ncbi:MAG TPA: hypothetical protein VLV89_08975 [Candidatus Acidoferrum sp.]|nr:hypothetical protein [Candidatus Acidoferrum sp.]
MNRTSTFCAVMLLVIMLCAASAGTFACQIDCVITSAPQSMGHAESCGGHVHMPGHAPTNEKGGHQHAGHSHNRIIAAAQESAQRTTLQQIGILPQYSGASALPHLNVSQRGELASAKIPSLIFTTPVLRI